jgi:hypothetical protein
MPDSAVIARYYSRCGICDTPILIDDPIVEVDGVWCHDDCAESSYEQDTLADDYEDAA